MALQIAFALPSGVSQTYHRIVRATADFKVGTTTLEIESYLSSEARANGMDPTGGMSVTFPIMFDFSGDPRAWGYGRLKGRPEFSGASDV